MFNANKKTGDFSEVQLLYTTITNVILLFFEMEKKPNNYLNKESNKSILLIYNSLHGA